MPFYTLAFWRGKGDGHLDDGKKGNYFIVTPDRDTSDLLFRFLQEGQRFENKYEFHEVKRVSPQYWTYIGTGPDVRDFFCDILSGKVAIHDKKFAPLRHNFSFQQFRSNDWFDRSPLPQVIIPHVDVADHVSGAEVWIRNKRMPDQYWYLNQSNNNVEPSPFKRTKFRVEYAKDTNDRETLLINDDDVVISAVGRGVNPTIGTDSKGELVTNNNNNSRRTTFNFGALLHGGFDLHEDNNQRGSVVRYNGPSYTYGEEWELV